MNTFYIFFLSFASHMLHGLEDPQFCSSVTMPNSKFWFEDNIIKPKKEFMAKELDSVFEGAKPLIAIVLDYANYLETWENLKITVEASGYNLRILKQVSILIAHRSLYDSGIKSEESICSEDVHSVCIKWFFNINNVDGWNTAFDPPFGNDALFRPGHSHSYRWLIVDYLDDFKDFPMSIYWGADTETALFYQGARLSVSGADIVQNSRQRACYPRTRDYSIARVCHQILKNHGKITDKCGEKDLSIFCTTCTKKIKDTSRPCSSLLKQTPSVSGALFCTGKDPRCCTYRALRVFPPKETSGTCLIS
jgi:hypothetical protein